MRPRRGAYASMSSSKGGIRDARGSSPISLNRKKLEPGEVQPLMCKDLISFGAFDFEFVDACLLYDIIKSKVP